MAAVSTGDRTRGDSRYHFTAPGAGGAAGHGHYSPGAGVGGTGRDSERQHSTVPRAGGAERERHYSSVASDGKYVAVAMVSTHGDAQIMTTTEVRRPNAAAGE